MLESENTEYEKMEHGIGFHGLTARHHGSTRDGRELIEISIDPSVADIGLRFLERLWRKIRRSDAAMTIGIELGREVDSVVERHQITARLFGSPIRLVDGHSLDTGQFTFRITRVVSGRGFTDKAQHSFLHLTPKTDEIPLAKIRDLLASLFEREILYFDDRLTD
jgi:hypothetical protein